MFNNKKTVLLDQVKMNVIVNIQIAREKMYHGIIPRYNPALDFVLLSEKSQEELDQLQQEIIAQWNIWTKGTEKFTGIPATVVDITGMNKGQVIEIAYGKDYRNVDVAIPIQIAKEMDYQTFYHVMDYNAPYTFGRLTDLRLKAMEQNIVLQNHNE